MITRLDRHEAIPITLHLLKDPLFHDVIIIIQ